MEINKINIDVRKEAVRKDAVAFTKNRLEEVKELLKEGRETRTKIQEVRYYLAGQMSVLMLLGTTYGQTRNELYQLRNEVNALARAITSGEKPEKKIEEAVNKYKKDLGE